MQTWRFLYVMHKWTCVAFSRKKIFVETHWMSSLWDTQSHFHEFMRNVTTLKCRIRFLLLDTVLVVCHKFYFSRGFYLGLGSRGRKLTWHFKLQDLQLKLLKACKKIWLLYWILNPDIYCCTNYTFYVKCVSDKTTVQLS